MLTRQEIGSILHYIADVFQSGLAPLTETPPTPVVEPEAPAPKRRGRPAANSAPAPATTVAPETQQTTAEPEKPADTAKPTVPPIKGMSYQDLQAVIQPLIKQVRGLEVKAVLNKYAPPDFKVDENNWYTLQALSEHPEHHAAFVANIQALLM